MLKFTLKRVLEVGLDHPGDALKGGHGEGAARCEPAHAAADASQEGEGTLLGEHLARRIQPADELVAPLIVEQLGVALRHLDASLDHVEWVGDRSSEAVAGQGADEVARRCVTAKVMRK